MRIDPNLARSRGAIPWPVLESGLWMRAGIAGAAVALASPAMGVTGEVSPLVAVTAFVVGACLAVFSYRRTRKLLGADDAAATTAPQGRAPALARPRSAIMEG